jgi:hypothetical protein
MPPKGRTAGASSSKRAKTGQVAVPTAVNPNTLMFRKGCVQILQNGPIGDVTIRKLLLITLFIFPRKTSI